MSERAHTPMKVAGVRYAFRCGTSGKICCSGNDPSSLCSRCKESHVLTTRAGRRQSLDGILLETRRHLGGLGARPTVDLMLAMHRDASGAGPYGLALRRDAREREPGGVIRDASGVPQPYTTALRRKQEGTR